MNPNSAFTLPETEQDFSSPVRGNVVKTVSLHEACTWIGLGFRFSELKTVEITDKIFYLIYVLTLDTSDRAEKRFNHGRYKTAHEILWLMTENYKRQLRQFRNCKKRGITNTRFPYKATLKEYDEKGVFA